MLENETSAVPKLVQRSERIKNGEGVSRFHSLTHLSEQTRTYFPKSSRNTLLLTLLPFRGNPRTLADDPERPISRRKSVWSISRRAQFWSEHKEPRQANRSYLQRGHRTVQRYSALKIKTILEQIIQKINLYCLVYGLQKRLETMCQRHKT